MTSELPGRAAFLLRSEVSLGDRCGGEGCEEGMLTRTTVVCAHVLLAIEDVYWYLVGTVFFNFSF